MKKKKKILFNVVTGFGGKLIIMAISFVVPRLMITGYGSEVNGLFTTLNNIYTYMALVEAGIGISAIQLLYKPVIDDDKQTINNILFTTKKYFYKCGWIYLAGVILLTLILPFAINTSINKWSVVVIALLQGFASLTNFFIVSGLTSLLVAEGKQYVTNNIVLVSSLLTNIAKIILVNLCVDIVILQIAYFLISLLVSLIYYVYFRVKYPWINRKSGDDTLRLPQRYSFLLHKFASLIFNNTDTILITFFCGLKIASVYAIYNMVFMNVSSLIESVFSGLKFLLGQKYNKDKDEYVLVHDTYKSYYCAVVFAVFSVTYILIIPFMRLYTRGVSDVEYVDLYLPLLFCLVNLLSSCRMTENNLIELSLHAKQTVSRAMIETAINLIVSVVMVNILGIYGCLIGTITALLYRTNDVIIYANRKILNRAPKQAYVTVISNFVLFALIIFVNRFVDLGITNYLSLVCWGVGLSVLAVIAFVILNAVTNPSGSKYLKERFLLHRAGKKNAR